MRFTKKLFPVLSVTFQSDGWMRFCNWDERSEGLVLFIHFFRDFNLVCFEWFEMLHCFS